MTSEERNHLLTLAAKLRRQDKGLATTVLVAGGIPEAYAAEILRQMESPLPEQHRFSELVARPLPEPRRAPCLIIAPKQPNWASELKSLRDLIIAPALERLPYEVDADWKPDPTDPAAMEVLQAAKLLIALLPARDPEVLYSLGFSRAYDKPTVVIAPNAAMVPACAKQGKTLVYRWSKETPSTISNSGELVRELRKAAVTAGVQTTALPKPFREQRSTFLLSSIYGAKRKALREFYLAMLNVRYELEYDYELKKVGSERAADAICAISELMREPGEIFRYACSYLHKAMEDVRAELPFTEAESCLIACEALDALAESACEWVNQLQNKPPTISVEKAKQDLGYLLHKAIDCRDLLAR